LISFCSTLEKVCIETVEEGKMTKDLALLIHGKKLDKTHYLTTQKFLSELKRNLERKISDK
jgi:isocitrate dehydrogenase